MTGRGPILAASEKAQHGSRVIFLGERQRRPAIILLRVDVGAGGDERRSSVRSVVPRREAQRRPPKIALRVVVGAGGKQHRRNLLGICHRRHVQWPCTSTPAKLGCLKATQGELKENSLHPPAGVDGQGMVRQQAVRREQLADLFLRLDRCNSSNGSRRPGRSVRDADSEPSYTLGRLSRLPSPH